MQIKRIFKIRYFNDALSYYMGIKLIENDFEEPYILAEKINDGTESDLEPNEVKIFFMRKKYRHGGFGGFLYYEYGIF
jgi:hypothetical protein